MSDHTSTTVRVDNGTAAATAATSAPAPTPAVKKRKTANGSSSAGAEAVEMDPQMVAISQTMSAVAVDNYSHHLSKEFFTCFAMQTFQLDRFMQKLTSEKDQAVKERDEAVAALKELTEGTAERDQAIRERDEAREALKQNTESNKRFVDELQSQLEMATTSRDALEDSLKRSEKDHESFASRKNHEINHLKEAVKAAHAKSDEAIKVAQAKTEKYVESQLKDHKAEITAIREENKKRIADLRMECDNEKDAMVIAHQKQQRAAVSEAIKREEKRLAEKEESLLWTIDQLRTQLRQREVAALVQPPRTEEKEEEKGAPVSVSKTV